MTMTYTNRLWNWILVTSLTLAGASAQLYRGPSGEIGETAAKQEYESITSQIGIDQNLGKQIPLTLTFRDETGKTVKLGDYFGKRPVILVMAYYECPMLCTVVLNELTRVMNALDLRIGKDFEVVTVSISPTETPELAAKKKANYVKSYNHEGAQQGWHFLVGDEPNIKQLADTVGFRYVYDPKTKQYAHSAGIMIATPDGKLSRYLIGVEFSARDLKFALAESSQGKIGNPVLSAVMYCFQYDPSTGRYGLVILRVIQLAGIITILSLATLIGGALLLERRRKQTTDNSSEVNN
ncbi:MAG: electron transporter SenC [Fimbriimonadales bacterium]|nr:MAG: electron transporter SenC [Fimbriimonadales bacterium]